MSPDQFLLHLWGIFMVICSVPVWVLLSEVLGLQDVPLFWLSGLQSKALFFRILGGGGFTLSVCVLAYKQQHI